MMKVSWNTHVLARKSAALWSLLPLMALGCTTEDVDPAPVDPKPVVRPFVKADCSHPLIPDSTTHCGTVEVPADREDPSSPLIKIFATVYPAKDSTTATAPLIYLTGGPGTSTQSPKNIFEITDENDFLAIYRQTFGDNRDLIVLDQRGTNNSEPTLYCSKELGPAREQAYAMKLADASTLRLAKLEECYKRLNAAYDLSNFNTIENAADVRDLALSLGYEKVNIFGASYGTRLTMMVMKLFPEIIENVAIDSVLPPEINPFEKQAEGAASALAEFWTITKTDFPTLETQFYETIAALETAPVTVMVQRTTDVTARSVLVTGVEYANFVFGTLRGPAPDPTLPASIVKMRQSMDPQDFAPVGVNYLNTIDFLFPTDEAGVSDSTSYGMFESVNAAADGFYTDLNLVESNIVKYLKTDSVREWGRQTFIYQNADVLGKWPVDPQPEDVLQPLVSDIPTILLVGTIDPGTPPVFSEAAAKNLSNARYEKILGGHAVCFQACASQLMDAFVKDPSTMSASMCPTSVEWMPAAP
jgi:pimeloyl-ACP methyl ester carboxylesterase